MSSPVQAGEIVAGKYRVDAVLGQGGMGIVVAATDTVLDRRVAVKFLLPQYAENKVASGRFLREARATARLNSEHAVRIIEVGELENGSPFMAMEFLQGTDLGSHIEQHGALEVKQAVDYVLQACRGLAEAHQAGIIHRDVKPSNLFLAYQQSGKPVVKVLDFGVSKLSLGVDAVSGSLTTTGQTLGSPLYMSPEQMRSSQSADARSDIWGLGVVLFELLTGARPFHADSLTELVLIINQEPPQDPKVLRPDLPDALCRVVLRCLEKDPNRRYATISEMADDLAPFGTRDSRMAARDIRSMRDQSNITIPGAPPVGRLGTLIATSGDPVPMAGSSVSVDVSQSFVGAAGTPGAMTSAPWASTHGGSAPGKRKPPKRDAGLAVAVASLLGVSAIVGAVCVWWFLLRTPKSDDDAIASAASELSESAAREQTRSDGAASATAAPSGGATAPEGTSTAPSASSSAEAALSASATEAASSDAPSESATPDENQSSGKKKRVRRRPTEEEPRSAKERLGF